MDHGEDAGFVHVTNRVLVVLKIAAFLVLVVGGPLAIWFTGRLTPSPLEFQQPTHSELIATLFTGAALMLGILAIIIAGLAIWGYVAIKKEATQIATSSAKREIERYMKRSATHHEMREIIEKLAAPILADLQAAAQMPTAYQDEMKSETTIKTVGKSYPKDKEA